VEEKILRAKASELAIMTLYEGKPYLATKWW
jgi:hypothetical protein